MLLLLSLLACTAGNAEKEDADGDGLLSSVDCDDNDAAVGLPTSFFGDGDGDGYGTDTISVEECTAPSGFVENDEDCNDVDALISPAASEHCDGTDENCDGQIDENPQDPTTFYADADGDGFGDPAATSSACTAPPGTVPDRSDCDDANNAIYPGAEEHCDGADEDCDGSADNDPIDGSIYYRDADGDSYGGAEFRACSQPSGSVLVAGDCDDSAAAINPDGTEVCNGQDDNCDGSTDNEATDRLLFYLDADTDGHGDPAVSTLDCSVPSGYSAAADDCDDGNPGIYTGAPEHCDRVDEDCDGVADNAAVDQSNWYADTDADGYGDPGTSLAACEAPQAFVADNTDCSDSSASVHPLADESCNGIDDDCDGSTDENDAIDAPLWYTDTDGDGYGDDSTGTPACTQPAGLVATGGDCDETDAAHSPATPEHCDGVDENCDGIADDSPVDGTAYSLDADGDSYGDPATLDTACTPPAGSVSNSSDCNDASASAYPGAAEHCDGTDEDCDGTADNAAIDQSSWYADSDGDGYGDASVSTTACTAPSNYVADNTDCDDSNSLYTTDCRVGCGTLRTYPGSVYATGFGTASSLSGFCSAYNAIDGDLTLDRTDLTSMAVFSCLCEVSGDLTIEGNSALTSLTGMENLGTVGGDLSIENNDRLPDYTGLSALSTIGGTLIVGSDNALMTDLVGFDSLTEVGSLSLTGTPLTSLDGLESLQTVDDLLYLYNNESLISIEGLQSLRTVGGQLYLYNNDLLPSLTGLEALETVGSTLTISGVDGIPDLRPLSGLTSADALYIASCDLIPDLSGLEGLTSLAGSLTIMGNNLQTSLNGLNNLSSVGGSVLISSHILDSATGLEGLTSIGGDLNLGSYGYTFSTYQGLNNLATVGGNVYLSDGPVDMQGLNALTTVGSGFYTGGSTYTTLRGLDSLTSVGDRFQLNLTSPASTVGLESLQTIGDSLVLENVSDTAGLTGVQTIGGSLDVSGTGVTYSGLSALTSVGGDVSSLNHSCAGLSALQSIGGQLYLSRDNGAGLTSLQNLGGLYASGVDPTAINVTTISGGVTLMDPPAMTSLNQVTSIGGNILVDGNIYTGAPLSSITGFQGLRTVGGGISMYHVDSLTSITGMSSLQSVAGELYIYAWYVSNLSGFSQVQSLGGLRLLGTRLSNLNSFSNLRTINGDLDIQAAYLLSDATGLHGVRSVTGNLTFASNGLSGAQVNTLIQTIGTANIGGIITNND